MFDSPIDRHRRTKKSLLPFWLLIVTILIVFGYGLYATVGPNPPIIVSKATTHLTAPLGKDGLPDYAAVLLADAMKGVTPETNAAVPLIEALGKAIGEGSERSAEDVEDFKLLCDTIGAEWPPDPAWQTPSVDAEELRIEAIRLLMQRVSRKEVAENKTSDTAKFISKDPSVPDEMFWSNSPENLAWGPAAEYYQDRMVDRPWSRHDLPFLAEWFENNSAAIDHLVSGVERPDWASPPLSWVRHENDSVAWSEHFSMATARMAARLLAARSMHYAGEHNWAAARRDAIASVKVSIHLSKGPSFMDQLIAAGVHGVGSSAVNQLAQTEGMPANELRLLLEEFNAIGPPVSVIDAINRGERIFTLALIREYLRGDHLVRLVGPQLAHLSVDWNIVLRRVNSLYDRAIAAGEIDEGHARRAAILEVDAAFQEARANLSDRITLSRRALTAKGRGEIAGDFFLVVVMRTFEESFAIEDRWRTHRALTSAAIALAIYRAENGEYPEALAALTSTVLSKMPAEPIYGGPFIYRRSGDTFLLYSQGVNEVDDGGSNYGGSPQLGRQVFEGIVIDHITDPTEAADLTAKIPKGADDLSLRAPLPIKPWPWEESPGDGSPAGSVESSSGD